MSNEKKQRTNLANRKKYSHLNDEELFLGIIRAIASANMSWEICKKFNLTVTELRIVKNSVEYTTFKDTYFDDVRDSVEYSHKEQLKIFSKYDVEVLRELKGIAFNCEKPAFKLQAMKLYLQHSGLSRSQLQSDEYQELKGLVESMSASSDDEVEDDH